MPRQDDIETSGVSPDASTVQRAAPTMSSTDMHAPQQGPSFYERVDRWRSAGAATGHGERPDSINNYRILEEIGSGGFGIVYLAERREPHVQRVALKIIKPGMETREVLARFEAERQALALMSHPNIARVLDAGVTDMGWPFFVMEYVRGEPLTAFCDRVNLPVQQRLELFIRVCEAVQHAHEKGIIHRDLKPSNILVSVEGSQFIPKIIDFGIAKALSGRLTDKTIATSQGQIIGTLTYMSPEQAEMNAVDIDTRTDIYSLGVVLYELVMGVVPIDAEKLSRVPRNELPRLIREVDPPTASARLQELGDAATKIATSRQTSVPALIRLLRGELEWIPMKAMRKERTRRYRTAVELADDVRNYLEGRPLVAGPESVAYRFSKTVKRHRIACLLVMSVTLALVVGAIGTTIMGLKAKRAESQTRDVYAVSLEMCANALDLAKTTGTRDRYERLAVVGEQIEQLQTAAELEGDDAALRRIVEFRMTMGDLAGGRRSGNLSRAGDALEHYREGARILGELFDRWPLDAMVAIDLGYAHLKIADALPADTDSGRSEVLTECLAAAEYVEHAKSIDALDVNTRRAIAVVTQEIGDALLDLGEFSRARGEFEDALDMKQQLHEEDPSSTSTRDVTTALVRVGDTLQREKLFDEAIDHFERALELRRLLFVDPTDRRARRDIAMACFFLGRAHSEAGAHEAALVPLTEAVTLGLELCGEDQTDGRTLRDLPLTLGMLGNAYSELGDLDSWLSWCCEAAPVLEEGVRVSESRDAEVLQWRDYCRTKCEETGGE